MMISQVNTFSGKYMSTRQMLEGLYIPKTVDIQINFVGGADLTANLSTTLPKVEKMARLGVWLQSLASKMLSAFTVVVMVVSLLAAAITFGPKAYYSVFSSPTIPFESQEVGTALGDFDQGANLPQVVEKYQPEYDPALPEGEWLVIPRIGVRTNMIKSEGPEEALDKGVWWVPEFGSPGDTDQPMILAAHRYGFRYMWETILDDGNSYALRHIFYKLPETEPGDRIEIIVDQRRYIYEIYAGEEGNEITDYEADLILYTCKFLDSPVRFVRYARLIDPTVDTQQR